MFQSPMWTHFDVYTSKSGIYAKNSCLALLSSRSRRSRLPASQARITPVDKRRGQTSCGRDGRSQSMQILLLLHVQGTGTGMHKKACPGFLENGQIITEHSIIDPRANIGFTNRKHGKDNSLTQLTVSLRSVTRSEQAKKSSFGPAFCQEEFYCELIVHGKRTAAEFYMAHFHFFVERERERDTQKSTGGPTGFKTGNRTILYEI